MRGTPLWWLSGYQTYTSAGCEAQGPSKFARDVLTLVRREERRLSGRRPQRRQLTATEKIEERVREEPSLLHLRWSEHLGHCLE